MNNFIIKCVIIIINLVIILGFDALIIVNASKNIKENKGNKKNKVIGIIFIIMLVLLSILFIFQDVIAIMDWKEYFIIEVVLELIVYFILFALSKFKKRGIGIIVIILLLIGILFFNIRNLLNSVDYVDTSTMIIEAHNSDFEEYCGEYVSSLNTKNLISKVSIYNSEESSKSISDSRKIYIVYNDEAYENNLEELLKKISVSKHYRIYPLNNEKSNNIDSDAGYYENGYIKTIIIEDVKSKTNN